MFFQPFWTVKHKPNSSHLKLIQSHYKNVIIEMTTAKCTVEVLSYLFIPLMECSGHVINIIWPEAKMAVILHKTILDGTLWNNSFVCLCNDFFFQILCVRSSRSVITGDKPLPDPMMVRFNGTRVCATMFQCHDGVTKLKNFPRYWTFVQWIPLTKASDGELWCFLWFVPE